MAAGPLSREERQALEALGRVRLHVEASGEIGAVVVRFDTPKAEDAPAVRRAKALLRARGFEYRPRVNCYLWERRVSHGGSRS